jgi:Quinohemoprotein amine dehydrogenase A, alpha subunit, haem binding
LIDFESMGETLNSGDSIMFVKPEKLATILAAFLLAASVRAQDLPEGAGKDLVMNVCTQCHDTARIVAKKRTKEDWNDLVDKMAARGAKATDEEFDTIVTYLTKYLGKEQPAEKTN